jgi:hypothetical protein
MPEKPRITLPQLDKKIVSELLKAIEKQETKEAKKEKIEQLEKYYELQKK